MRGGDAAQSFAWPVVELGGHLEEALRRVHGQVGALGCVTVCQAAGRDVVKSRLAGPGSDLSEELVVGVEPAALDFRVAPGCPPGFAAMCRSSVIMVRQMRSARRRGAVRGCL